MLGFFPLPVDSWQSSRSPPHRERSHRLTGINARDGLDFDNALLGEGFAPSAGAFR
jgi:hypothetical protein